MKNKQRVIQFRGDEDVYQRAQERMANNEILFPDVMRAALKAVADGDVVPFADLLNEASLEGGEINQAWLFQKCHELFNYRDGMLFRKSRKGMGVQGTPAYIRVREGDEHVLIQGRHYPLKDIVWLMANGSVSGRVVYKNPLRVNKKHALENLVINSGGSDEISITRFLSETEKSDICLGKQRALAISAENDAAAFEALEELITRGKTIPLVLRGENGWIASRTAIHAFKIDYHQYIVSVS